MGNGKLREKQPVIKLKAKPRTLVKFYFIHRPAIQLGLLHQLCLACNILYKRPPLPLRYVGSMETERKHFWIIYICGVNHEVFLWRIYVDSARFVEAIATAAFNNCIIYNETQKFIIPKYN